MDSVAGTTAAVSVLFVVVVAVDLVLLKYIHFAVAVVVFVVVAVHPLAYACVSHTRKHQLQYPPS
jgi:hypothetical protein